MAFTETDWTDAYGAIVSPPLGEVELTTPLSAHAELYIRHTSSIPNLTDNSGSDALEVYGIQGRWHIKGLGE